MFNLFKKNKTGKTRMRKIATEDLTMKSQKYFEEEFEKAFKDVYDELHSIYKVKGTGSLKKFQPDMKYEEKDLGKTREEMIALAERYYVIQDILDVWIEGIVNRSEEVKKIREEANQMLAKTKSPNDYTKILSTLPFMPTTASSIRNEYEWFFSHCILDDHTEELESYSDKHLKGCFDCYVRIMDHIKDNYAIVMSTLEIGKMYTNQMGVINANITRKEVDEVKLIINEKEGTQFPTKTRINIIERNQAKREAFEKIKKDPNYKPLDFDRIRKEIQERRKKADLS